MTDPLRYGVVFKKDYLYYLISSSAFPTENFEGDYTSWEKQWINLVPQNLNSAYEFDWAIDERNDILYMGWTDYNGYNRWGVYYADNFSCFYQSSIGVDYQDNNPYIYYNSFIKQGNVYLNRGGISMSIQSYILLKRNDGYTIEIWREGSKLWARDIRDDFHTDNCECAVGGISLSGKYLLFLVFDDDTNLYNIMLYKGGTDS